MASRFNWLTVRRPMTRNAAIIKLAAVGCLEKYSIMVVPPYVIC